MGTGGKIIIVTISIIVAVLLIIIMIPWGIRFGGLSLLPNPPKPQITQGEFPFTLVYEINGEEKTIKDTLICEYDGVEINTGQGKVRKWKQSLASGNSKILLWVGNNVKSISGDFSPTAEHLEVYYDPGPAWYHMGDGEYEADFPMVAYSEYAPGETEDEAEEGYIGNKKLLNRFGIKIISWDCTPPITNTFE